MTVLIVIVVGFAAAWAYETIHQYRQPERRQARADLRRVETAARRRHLP